MNAVGSCYPHRLKFKGWAIVECVESLELSFIAVGTTTLEYQQYLLQLNVQPSAHGISLPYSLAGKSAYVFRDTCRNLQGRFI